MKPIKVEVENLEVALKNSHGDVVIIPKNKASWVKQKLSEGCHVCIDSLVESLPSMKDYAEDGTIIPKEPIYQGGVLEEVIVTAEAPQWLKYKREAEAKYNKDLSFKENPYLKKYKPERHEALLNSYNTARESYVKESVAGQILKNNPYDKKQKADDYFMSLSEIERGYLENSTAWDKSSKTYLDKIEGGLLSINSGPVQFKNPSYTKKEAKESTPLDIVEGVGGYASKPLQALGNNLGLTNFKRGDGKKYNFTDALQGKQNDAGMIADAATDLTNFIGVGLWSKLSKANKFAKMEDAYQAVKGLSKEEALSKLNQIAETPNSNVFNNALSEIKTKSQNIKESVGYELKNLSKKTNPKYQKWTKEELDKANSWSENWYNDPATKKRIELLEEEKYQREIKDLEVINTSRKLFRENPENWTVGFSQKDLNELYRNLPTPDKNNEYTELLKRIEDKAYVSTFESKNAKLRKLLAGEKRTHKDNYGLSGRNINSDYKGTRQNLVDKYSKEIGSTGIHEGNHGVTDGNRLIPYQKQEDMVRIFGDDTKVPLRNSKGEFDTYDEYLEDPTEIYARIMELRRYANFKPGEIISTETIDKLIVSGLNYNTPVDPYFFVKIKNEEKFKELFNNLATIVGSAIVGTQAIKNTKEQ